MEKLILDAQPHWSKRFTLFIGMQGLTYSLKSKEICREKAYEGACIPVDGTREVYWGNFCIAEDCLRLLPSQMSLNYKRVEMEISNLGINVWNNTDGYIAINIIFHCDKVKGGLVFGLQSLQKLNFFDLRFLRRRGNKQ